MGISLQVNLNALKADLQNSITTAKDSIETAISGAVDTIEGSAETRKTVLQLAIADVVTGGEGSAQIIIDALDAAAAGLSGEIAAKSAIKSIQTGVVSEFGEVSGHADIDIAQVNASKSVALVHSIPLVQGAAVSDCRYDSTVILLSTGQKVRVFGRQGVTYAIWQVIEYV